MSRAAAVAAKDAAGKEAGAPAVPTLRTIERSIVVHLAALVGRDVDELDVELHRAGVDLPVEPSEIVQILPALEREYGIDLPVDAALLPRLPYAREVAKIVRRRLAARRHAVRRPPRVSAVGGQ